MKRIAIIASSVFLALACFTSSNAQLGLPVGGGSSVTGAVCTQGQVYTWGLNRQGPAGNIVTGTLGHSPADQNVPAPRQVTFPAGTLIQQLGAGSGGYFLALDCQQRVWGWGDNSASQLGDGTATTRTAPVRVIAPATLGNSNTTGLPFRNAATGQLQGIVKLFAGNSTSLAITDDGRLLSWGCNGAGCGPSAEGLLGDGTTNSRNTPGFVLTAAGTQLENVIDISIGDNVALALVDENQEGIGLGTVYSWGTGRNGTLGRNAAGTGNNTNETTASSFARPVRFANNTQGPSGDGYLRNIQSIAAGDVAGLALDIDGYVWAWGNGGYGGVTGQGSTNTHSDPRKVIAGQATGDASDGTYLLAQSIASGNAFAMAVGLDGRPYAWGNNGCATNAIGPAASPNFACGGNLGNNGAAGYPCGTTAGVGSSCGPVPIQNGAGAVHTDVVAVARGDFWGYYIRQDNSVWAWGDNIVGQLGVGDYTTRNRAVAFGQIAQGCVSPDPAPQAKISPRDTLVCASKLGSVAPATPIVLNAGMQASAALLAKYEFTWYRVVNPTSNITSADTSAGNIVKVPTLGTAGLTYNATAAGRYWVRVKYTGTNVPCGGYPAVYDYMTIQTYPQTFTVPGFQASPRRQAYCGDTAYVGVTPNGSAGTNPVFSYYAVANGGTAIGTSTGSGISKVLIPNGTTNKGTGTVRLYVEETSNQSGLVLTKAQLVDQTFGSTENINNNQAMTPNYQSGFTTKEAITLTSLTLRLRSDIYTAGGTQTATINFAIYGGKGGNGGIVADASKNLGTFTYNFTRTRAATGDPQTLDADYIVPVNVTIPAGATFFISPSPTANNTISANSGLAILRGNVGNQAQVGDDLNPDIVNFVSLSQNFQNNQTGNDFSQGMFFNVRFKTSQGFCDRIPVDVQLQCPCQQPSSVTATTTPSPAGTPKSISVCQGTAITLSGSYVAGSNPVTSGIRYVWYKKGSPVGTYTAVPVGANTTLITGAVANTGTYVLRVEDGVVGNASCYREDSVRVVVNAVPAIVNIPDVNVCQGATGVSIDTSGTKPATDRFVWYTADAPAVTGRTLTRPTVNTATASSTTYFVGVVNKAAPFCESATRDQVSVTVNALPSTVNVPDVNVCQGASGISIDTSVTKPGTARFVWYTADAPAVTGRTLTRPTVNTATASTTTYYVGVVNKATPFCESATRDQVVVTVNSSPSTVNIPDVNVCQGSTGVSIDTSGTKPATDRFVWYTADAPATTGRTLTRPTVNTASPSSTTYFVGVVNKAAPFCESATRDQVAVTVNALPSTVNVPDVTVCQGATGISIDTSVTKPGTTRFVWYTADAPATTGRTLTRPTVNTATASTTTYYVGVVNKATPFCESATRDQVVVTINSAPSTPTFTISPNKTSFCVGEAHTLTAASTVNPSSTITYQWSNANTGTTATINGTTTQGTFTYEVIATANSCPSAKGTQIITVTPVTAISKQPKDTTLCEGTALNLSVSATGTGAISYVWKRGATTVGGNSRILNIPSVATTDAGAYTVEVTSGCGTVVSNTATVTVNTRPAITTQPTDKGGCVGSSTSLSVVASGTPAPTFAWTPTGSATGGLTSTLSFASLAATDAGNYTVTATNSCGTATSNVAKVAITLNETPAVTLATSISQACGDGTKTVLLSAGAAGGGPAPTFTFKESGNNISPANQTANTFTYTIPANATTAVQTLKFTVDMVSNTGCPAAGASLNVSGAAPDFSVDPRVTATIANIIENNETICVPSRTLTTAALPASYTATWTTLGGGANVSNAGVVSAIGVGQSTTTTYRVESPLKLCPSAEEAVTTTRAGQLTDPNNVVSANNNSYCETAPAPTLTGLSGLQPGETGTWSVPTGSTNTVSPTGQTGNLQVGTNRFIYTINSSTAVAPCNVDTALVTINIEKQPDAAVAGAAASTCALTYQLGATPVTNGTGTWTGGTVMPATSPTGEATLTKNVATTFTWTVSNGVGAKCADKSATVTITQAGDITSATPVSAQSKTICSTDAAPLLNTTGVGALTSNESGAWSAVSPATIDVAGQTAGLVEGDNTFRYTITTSVPGCDPSVGTVVIKVVTVPTASITAPIAVGNNATGNTTRRDLPYQAVAGTPATGYTGAWTVSGVGTATPSGTTAEFTSLGDFNDQTTLVWTVRDNTLPTAVCPAATSTLVVTRKDFSVADAQDDSICVTEPNIIIKGNAKQATGETATWTALDGGTIAMNADQSEITVTNLPAFAGNFGTFRFEYSITNTNLVPNVTTKDIATLKVYAVPTAAAGSTETICGSSYELKATAPTIGTGKWTAVPATITFDDVTKPNAIAGNLPVGSAGTPANMVFTWTVSNGLCTAATSNVTIIRSGDLTDPNAAGPSTSCVGSSINLTGNNPSSANSETSIWTVTPTIGVTFTPTVNQGNQSATFTAAGTYVFSYAIDNPTCNPSTKTVTVVVSDKPVTGTVTGTDPDCEDKAGTYNATGFTSSLPVTYAWTSTPSGTSTATTTDATQQTVIYNFKSTNPTAATDNATVTVVATNGCGTATNNKVVSYNLKPRVFDVPSGIITGSTNFCSTIPTTQPYTVSTSAQATSYNWKWNTQTLSGTTTSNNLTDIIWGTATSGTLEVVLGNACGVSTYPTAKASLAITINQPVDFTASIASSVVDNKFCVPQGGVTYTASSTPPGVIPTGYTFTTTSSSATQTSPSNKSWLPAIGEVQDKGIVTVVITASNDPNNANFACLKNYTASASVEMDGYKYPDSLIVSSNDTICDNQSDIVLSVNRSTNASNRLNDNGQIRWFLNDTIPQPQFNDRFSIKLGEAYQTGTWKVAVPGSVCSTHVSVDTHRVKIYEQPNFLFAEDPMVVVYYEGITKRMPVILVSPARDSITKTTWTNETWLEYPNNDTLNALFVPKREQVELNYSLILRTGPAKFNCTNEKPLVVINALPLNIPNAFSPNGDGVNDTWVINGLIKYSSVTVNVFNRWGNRVFQSTGGYTPWDGTVNGIPVSTGTYYMIVELKGSPDNSDANITKALTIVR